MSFRNLGLLSSAFFPVIWLHRNSSPARLNALRTFPDVGSTKVQTCSESGGSVRMEGKSLSSSWCFL